jgi:hypothetical protein
MGRPWRNNANDHTGGVLSFFLIVILLVSLLYVDPFQYPSTMGIMMWAVISKEKPTRTTITPKQAQRTTRLSKSPHSDNVNSLLAEINLPTSRFNNILEALRPITGRGSDKQGNTLNNPCDLELPADKDNQITPNASPTGVDTFTLEVPSPVNNADPPANKDLQDQQTPSTRGVCINDMAMQVEALTTPARTSSQRHKSILQSSINIDPPSHKNEEDVTKNEYQPKEIHDHSQKLFHVFSEDGMKETSYHVTNFAGLYPVLPIIEFSMSPTGNTKDKRMSSFTKCITALLGEMLYVNNTAMITPIAITDNDKASYISSKANLPTNFTKLGKHIMISAVAGCSTKRRGEITMYTHTSG